MAEAKRDADDEAEADAFFRRQPIATPAEVTSNETRRRQETALQRKHAWRSMAIDAFHWSKWNVLMLVAVLVWHHYFFVRALESASTLTPTCYCAGCRMRWQTTNGTWHEWPLHSSTTLHKQRPSTPLQNHELRTGIISGSSLTILEVANTLAEHLSARAYEGRGTLCMYELQHGLKEDYRICVMQRNSDHFVLMVNPELKGFAEADTSEMVAERSVVCGRRVHARRRRIAVEISFAFPWPAAGNVPDRYIRVRSMLDDKDEAFAFQQHWDVMRGMYNCSE